MAAETDSNSNEKIMLKRGKNVKDPNKERDKKEAKIYLGKKLEFKSSSFPCFATWGKNELTVYTKYQQEQQNSSKFSCEQLNRDYKDRDQRIEMSLHTEERFREIKMDWHTKLANRVYKVGNHSQLSFLPTSLNLWWIHKVVLFITKTNLAVLIHWKSWLQEKTTSSRKNT